MVTVDGPRRQRAPVAARRVGADARRAVRQRVPRAADAADLDHRLHRAAGRHGRAGRLRAGGAADRGHRAQRRARAAAGRGPADAGLARRLDAHGPARSDRPGADRRGGRPRRTRRPPTRRGSSCGATAPAEVCVRGDAHRLQQVVRNLVGNAIKFTPAGGAVSLAISTDGDHGVLVVEDQGIGVSRRGAAAAVRGALPRGPTRWPPTSPVPVSGCRSSRGSSTPTAARSTSRASTARAPASWSGYRSRTAVLTLRGRT